MGNKVILILFMAVPALFTFLLMKFLQDAVITLFTLILTYLILIFVYHSFIDEIGFKMTLAKEFMKKSENISLGGKLAGAGVGLGIVGILYCMFIPFGGPESVVLPFPINPSAAKRTMYYTGFAILYLLRAPIENLFYNYVICTEFNEKGGAAGALGGLSGEDVPVSSIIIISLFNALMQFAAFYFVVNGAISAIVLSLIGFGINWGLLTVRSKNGIIASSLFSIGLAVGGLLILLYFNFTLKGTLPRKRPEFFFPGNLNNCWMKWFKAKMEAGSGTATEEPATSGATTEPVASA